MEEKKTESLKKRTNIMEKTSVGAGFLSTGWIKKDVQATEKNVFPLV